MIADLLSEQSVKRRGYFNPSYVQQLIRDNASGRHDYNYLIYILLSFELWCRVYIDAPAGAKFAP
jgi:asparagine synthase (glutamine-hydrolysing)